MMDEESRKRFDEQVGEIIEDEMTPQGDLLPVQIRYPQIPRYSIGWRMGADVLWLEERELVNQSEFKTWFENRPKK